MSIIGTSKTRKYSINGSFFNMWSADMAYVFGFWIADGYMRIDKSYRISFSSADREILVQIRDAMHSTHPIQKDSRSNCWNLYIFSKALYFGLLHLGGSRAKSRTISFPSVPNQYIRDFIRGYFDGDGSIHYISYVVTKTGKRRRELRSNFTSGNILFLKRLNMLLNEILDVSIKKIGVYNNGGSHKLGFSEQDTQKLLRFIHYPTYSLGLKRKAAFAIDAT